MDFTELVVLNVVLYLLALLKLIILARCIRKDHRLQREFRA